MTIANVFACRLCMFLAAFGLILGQSTAQAQTVIYYHTDALGSPVATTDASGNVIERSEYEPYGQLLNRPLADGPGYTGHVSDAQTGLSHMQQRYYDPQIGRFLSRDPVTADANTGANFNAYWYANNNPYRFTDPDGRQSVQEMIDSGAEGCGAVSCAGWAALSASWKVLGAEGVSQIADKGWSGTSTSDKAGAGLEVLGAVPGVKLLGAAGKAAEKGAVVIGETMARVEVAAAKIPGAKMLNDMPDFKSMGMNANQVTSAMMQHNRKWILEQMRSGRQIIDIGADPNRAVPSIFYEMEKKMLENYQKLHPGFPGAVSP